MKNIHAYDVDEVSLKNFEAFDKAMQKEDIKMPNAAKAGLPAQHINIWLHEVHNYLRTKYSQAPELNPD